MFAAIHKLVFEGTKSKLQSGPLMFIQLMLLNLSFLEIHFTPFTYYTEGIIKQTTLR